jgi:dipeptidase
MIAAMCVFLSLFLLLLGAGKSRACTTVIVGKRASVTGEILVGHNEDSDGRYVMWTHVVPPKASAPSVRFEPESALIPMPGESAGLFWSEARSYRASGASFCDFYVNSNGVVICSDSCGPSKEDSPEISDGGVGYGVRRVVAETAKSACHAVEITTGLIDRYGYIGNGRSYHFADRDEAWVVQVAGGKHYAVKRVPDDEVYLIPNHFTIRAPSPETPHLAELISYAVGRDWCGLEEATSDRFDFARAYQALGGYRPKRSFHRHLRGLEIILGTTLDPDADLPFSVRPPRKIGVNDIKKVLRSHFEGTADDISSSTPWGTPHAMETRAICDESTLESNIVQIRDDPSAILIRRAFGKPCLSPYTPWYPGMTRVPEGFEGGGHEYALSTHFSSPASDFDYSLTPGWRAHVDLQTAIELLYPESAADVRKRVTEFEKAIETRIAEFEDSPARRACDDFVATAVSESLSLIARLYENLGIASPKFVGIETPYEFDADKFERPVTVRVESRFAPENVVLERTILGIAHIPLSGWSRAQKCRRAGDSLEITFNFAADWADDIVPCACDMWLLLIDDAGARVVGKIPVTFKY